MQKYFSLKGTYIKDYILPEIFKQDNKNENET